MNNCTETRMEPHKLLKAMLAATLYSNSGAIVYLTYMFYKPYQLRKHFKQYKNVYLSPKYDLVYGDYGMAFHSNHF